MIEILLVLLALLAVFFPKLLPVVVVAGVFYLATRINGLARRLELPALPRKTTSVAPFECPKCNQVSREVTKDGRCLHCRTFIGGPCPDCGYDLRGLDASPTCPECGSAQVECLSCGEVNSSRSATCSICGAVVRASS